MPVGFNSPARNFFLLGSSGAELVTNFFKTITSPDSASDAVYRAEEIRYDYGSDTYTLAGWGQDNNSTQYGWVENRNYNPETGGSTQTWRNLVKSSIANNDLRIKALEVDNGYGLVAVGIANDAPFIAKYDGFNGTLDFQSTSNSGNVIYSGIAVDINKNYYACGNTLVGDRVGFIEKYDSTGIPGWGKSASYEFSDVRLEKIAVNSKGGVVAVGSVFDDAGTKGYIVKVDSLTGDVLWDKTLKRSSEDQVLDIILPRGVFIDSEDFIYVVGFFQDVSASKSFILKYSPEGNLLWQRETDDANGDPIQYYEVKADGNTGQVIVFGRYEDTFNNDELGLLTKYSRNGDLVWRRTIKSSYNQSLKFGFEGGAGVALDFDESFYYLLFTDDVLDVAGRTPEGYTFGKVSSSGNGLGQFEYSDGVGETMTYTIIEIPDRIGRIQDGSVRIETSGLISYPFNANKLLFDDYATSLSNKKRQLEDGNVFQYSGSPSVRLADFAKLDIGTESIDVNVPAEEALYDQPGTYTFTVPDGVTEVSAVAIGGGGGSGSSLGTGQSSGGGGGGGGLAWGTFTVTPGEDLTVVVGAGGAGAGPGYGVAGNAGEDSSISRASTVLLQGGGGGAGLADGVSNGGTGVLAAGGTSTGSERDGGGVGGQGGAARSNNGGGGGGGAGGYNGQGGPGGTSNSVAGEGGEGGGGGGGSGQSAGGTQNNGGGGVGIFGGPISGAGGAGVAAGDPGKGGSNGQDGQPGGVGGKFGGGGGGPEDDTLALGADGGDGGVRIIWGAGRSFPDNALQSFSRVEQRVPDRSGKNNKVVVNGPTILPTGRAWDFDSTANDCLLLDEESDLANITGDISIEAWFKIATTNSGNRAIWSKGRTPDPGGGTEMHSLLWVSSSNTLAGLIGNLDGTASGVGTQVVTANQWYHVVLTSNGTNNKIYVNGVLNDTNARTSEEIYNTNQNGGVAIGRDVRYPTTENRHWDGEIGELRVYDKALTAAQVYQNYNVSKARYLFEAPSVSPKVSPGIVIDNNLLLNYDFGNKATYDPAENLIESSEDFSNSQWTSGGTEGKCDVIDTDILSPFGTRGVQLLDDTSTAGDGQGTDARISITPSNTRDYCVSVYAKKGTAEKFDLYLFYVDVSVVGYRLTYVWDDDFLSVAGAEGANGVAPDYGYENVGNGWYRFWLSAADQSLNTKLQMRLYPGSRDTGLAGSTYFWGAQAEEGSTPGRYVKTYGTDIVGINSPNTVNNLSSANFSGIITGARFNSGGWFEFDGTNEEIITSDNINQANLPLTYECWVRTANGYSPSGYVSLMSTYDPNPEGFWILLNPTNAYVTAGNDGSTFHVSSTSVNDGEWHHVVATLDIPNVRIYVDGVDVGGLNNAPNNIIPSTRFVRIGSMSINGSSDRFLDGDIGEARIYNRALSSTEVSQNYNATRAKYGV